MNLKFLNSFHLKNIALATMIIDHIGSVFFPDIVILRIIGRISFVLYAFLLVNGCIYSSNIPKYLSKLFLWSLLSEIPYDLVFNDSFISFKTQNIFFTLFVGALGIYYFKKSAYKYLRYLFFCIGILIAYFLNFDYSWYGVGLIYGLYLLNKFELIKYGFVQGFSTFYSVCYLSLTQFFAFLGIIPIYLYNGKIGKKAGNIYYSYYAIHLLLFYILKKI